MAKPSSIKIKMESSAGTGYFYVTRKSTKPKPGGGERGKLSMQKYDPVARKHVLFTEGKVKA